jgi:hypothetical protein
MKRSFLAIILFSALFFSCAKEKEDKQYNTCGSVHPCNGIQCVAFLSNFSFTIVDEATGTDLIFGSNPTLFADDIKLFVKSNSPYTQVPVSSPSSVKALNTIFSSDTMALQIKNEPLKFIVVKQYCTLDCCSRTAVEILYEGKLLVADDKKLIRIQR